MAMAGSDGSSETLTPASVGTSVTTPGTPGGFDALSYDKLDRLLQRNSDDPVANGLSACITFSRMGVQALALAELPALRQVLLTAQWISVAHLEAVYDIANSLDMPDLHKVLADYFIQRGLHLRAAGVTAASEGGEGEDGATSATPTASTSRYKQVRHPLLASIAEQARGGGEESDSGGSDGSGSDGEGAQERAEAAQGALLVMPHTSASPPSASGRRGRNSSPATLLGLPASATQPGGAAPEMASPSSHSTASIASSPGSSKQRTMSWVVPGGLQGGRTISARTLYRWRQELQEALDSVDSAVAAAGQGLAAGSGFKIVDMGNADSPRGRRLPLSPRAAAAASEQFGSTPASDFVTAMATAADTAPPCPACHMWELRYTLLRSESEEQVAHLRATVAQLRAALQAPAPAVPFASAPRSGAASASGSAAPSPAGGGSATPLSLPDGSDKPGAAAVLQLAPPPRAAHRRGGRGSVCLDPTQRADSGSEQEGGLELSLNSRLHRVSALAQDEHSKWEAALEQQERAFGRRERRWKTLTGKLSARLEHQNAQVKVLRARLGSMGGDCSSVITDGSGASGGWGGEQTE